MPGRPKVNRRKDSSERGARHTVSKVGKKIMCSVCKQAGHNKVTCSKSEKPTKLKPTKLKPTDEEGGRGNKGINGKVREGSSGRKRKDGKDDIGGRGKKLHNQRFRYCLVHQSDCQCPDGIVGGKISRHIEEVSSPVIIQVARKDAEEFVPDFELVLVITATWHSPQFLQWKLGWLWNIEFKVNYQLWKSEE
ncbi:unnamed protein product [Lactuca virosa]|uniref:Uncharacterized protein n=1 Tax=Lactuca virosa TaxID=75947 RepID=A0AAU9MQ33_9ASTR|nr:unnamed protein product [Lactuca virosa]